jgi:O-antigen/teichoic acid export membrane protein
MLTKLKSFFLENKTAKQTVAKNSFRLLLSEFIARIFTFLISLRVARSLGVLEF